MVEAWHFETGSQASMGAAGKALSDGALEQPKPKRARGLFVLPSDFTPRAGVPDECPTTMRCEYVECRFHLWRVDPWDREGRRDEGKGRAGPAPGYQSHSAATCALDECRRGPMRSSEVGRRMGLSARRVEQVLARAVEKLRAVGNLLIDFASDD